MPGKCDTPQGRSSEHLRKPPNLDATALEAATNAPPVSILILNWNGVADTLECLESVFRSDYPSFRVIICDNGSEDGSVERVAAWAEGKIDAASPASGPLSPYPCPPFTRPIPHVIHDRSGAEKGGTPADADARLVIIRNGANLGYAAGNNVGLRYILARDDFTYVWLLNNDTVVTPGALSALVRRMIEKPDAGLCGSTLLYYDKPEKVQALGGFVYNTWFACSHPIGHERTPYPSINATTVKAIESRMFGVQGAAVLASRAFLRDVGLMGEEYFLYFEEQDWAERARGRYGLAYAAESIVYHKEGAKTGSSSQRMKEKSVVSDFYSIRNRIVFTRKYFPLRLPTVYLGLLGAILNRIARCQWQRIWMILNIGLHPDRKPSQASLVDIQQR